MARVAPGGSAVEYRGREPGTFHVSRKEVNNMTDGREKSVVVIGAGPAGLTAALELTEHHVRPIVLEQRDKVGGIACTESYKGYRFDMGGHRFFTKSKAVNKIWQEALGVDFLRRPRLSRIYYRGKFFHYPLKPFSALWGLGIWQAILVVLSFIKWQLFPHKLEKTFEQWVTNRFGKRLFETFFKTYTEKVWGIACSELKAEFAAQRIKDLSLKTAVLNTIIKPKHMIKTLIEAFDYPRLGPGMMWEQVKREIEQRQGIVLLNSQVIRIPWAGNRIESVVISCGDGAEPQTIYGTDFVSSMPVREFIQKLDPSPAGVLEAANKLTYRDFLTVCLIVNKPDLFPDNWIYVHSPEVKVGRIQNFKNWSPDMVPDPSKTGLGLEYFCTEGDELWNMPDADLIELGKREIERIGLARYADIEDAHVFRVPKAYPIYDADYGEYLAGVKEFIGALENFQTIGRGGLHRYNNMDHSMITGMLAARNVALGEKNDVWSINGEQEYHEELCEVAEEDVDADRIFREALTRVFPRLDPVALGFAVGVISGLVLFLVTLTQMIKDGGVVGPNLTLLSQFFPGYQVDVPGSLVGLLYASILGFVLGWGFAYLRNFMVFLGAIIIHHDIEWHLLRDLLDYT
jgi:protoporphyrinogen oxidase